MKRFTFSVVIEEGSDEFWEELEKEKDLGISTVTDLVKESIESTFNYNFEVTLTEFEYKP